MQRLTERWRRAALGIKAPPNYSVYSASAGAFVLSTMRDYGWALENRRLRKEDRCQH